MKYSKNEIGITLIKELNKGYNIEEISNWAYDLFINMRDESNAELNNILERIYIMDAGPEFIYTERELRLLADMLINEEKDPIKKIDELKIEKS